MLRNLAENVRCRIWRNLAESGAWLPLWLEKLGKLEKLEKGCFLEKKLEKLKKDTFSAIISWKSWNLDFASGLFFLMEN